MMEYLQEHQLEIMLVLSSICLLLAFFACITKSISRKKRAGLLLTELSAAIMLWADRLAYIYRGNTSDFGGFMVRFSNFTVFFFTLFILVSFNIYLEDLFVTNGKVKNIPKRLYVVTILVALGILMLIISQFTGWYYYFDETNHYQRGPLFIVSYIVPLLSLFIQLSSIFDLYSSLSRVIRTSLICFTTIPIIASIVQIFVYGISLTNISIVGTAVLLYIFALIDINNTAEKATRLELEYLKKSQQSSRRLFEQTATALVNAIDAKDKYTHGHSSRVAEYSRKIAEALGKSEDECREIYYAALLHDVGKIGIPKEIINKEGKLTKEEYEVIKQHPVVGKQILSSISEYPYLSIGANHHHERYDGKGYPDKLKGEDIPEIARIVAVADAYDAMTSKRSYRDPIPQQKVREEFVKGAGAQFDPEFSKIMLHLIDLDSEYEMKEKADVRELAGKNELECKKYRDIISEGIVVTPFITRIHLKSTPLADAKSDPKVCLPSLILFDSLDGRIHLDEKMKNELNYCEYGQFRFDGAYVNSELRTIQVEKIGGASDKNAAPSALPGPVEYDVELVKFRDHMLLKIQSALQTITYTIAFPDSSRYAYISLTGEYCFISGVEITKEEKMIEPSYIPRIAEEISYIDVPAGDIPNVQVDGYRTASSEGIPFDDEMEISFHSKSLPTARLVWHCPFVVLYTSDDATVNGPGYREFALIRFDGENWETDDRLENKMIVSKNAAFTGWDVWKVMNRIGFDCTVTFKRKGNVLTVFTENGGISIKNITTLDQSVKNVYVTLTGDQCAITNIRIKK
ncbi:MAG: HD domain-containing protein [Treponema sp.]|nr:HD domain-containing protein [Treponema sp.]